ncbi:MAG TPA: UDP-N-acetylmuramate dehydrogenase [Polyangiaceae bacterium]
MPIQPRRDVPMAKLTTFQVGGLARYFYEAVQRSEVVDAVKWAQDARVALHVLGGGSNLVIADTGLSGLVLHVTTRGISAEQRGSSVFVRAEAGEMLDDVVAFAVERDLAGIECLSGIPGTVGATPIQNVGAYGQEIAQTLTSVTAYDRERQVIVSLGNDECEFAYRNSRFKSREPDRFVILSVEFELRNYLTPPIGNQEVERVIQQLGPRSRTVEQIRLAVLGLRKNKSLLNEGPGAVPRSAGSFFLNPIVDADAALTFKLRFGPSMPAYSLSDGRTKLSAGWLIEQAGYARGHDAGNVGLSAQHCLVIVAKERAQAENIVAFAHEIRQRVRAKFGIELIPEPSFWGFYQFEAGLPMLEELAPPTLGSAHWPASERS